MAQAVHINCIRFGNDPLNPMEKFNLYSWKALGYDASVYAIKWDTKPHNASSLGLDGKIRVVDLYELVTETDAPLATFKKARELLTTWLEVAKKKAPVKGDDLIYNIADLSKAYIAGTRKGIVLDLKVGPSKWVEEYLGAFEKKFISYTRGLNTAGGLPENQALGTMEVGGAIRTAYQKAFEGRMGDITQHKAEPTTMWFNAITGWHGNACKTIGFLNTAKCLPTGAEAPKDQGAKVKTRLYDVMEIQGTDPGHGPFRVFKRPDDQSNKGGEAGKTPEQHVKNLMDDAWKELVKHWDTEKRTWDEHFKTEAAKVKKAYTGKA